MDEETYIIQKLKLYHERNDPNINNYNKDISKLVQSNMDIRFVEEKYSLINYISKYITKTEVRSNIFKKCQKIMHEIFINHDMKNLTKDE